MAEGNESNQHGGNEAGNSGKNFAPVEAVDQSQPRKPAIRILEQQITEGLTEIRRSTSGLLMAGFSAGLDLGFSVFLIAVILTVDEGALPRILYEIILANAYAVGFVLVIIGRSELFTEHTALAILPVLNGRASIRDLLRLWGLIYIANLAGGMVFALIASFVGPQLGVIRPSAFGEIAHQVVDHPWWVILVSGVLAGWLMGLLSWLVTAARETVSQVLIIFVIMSTIGLSRLHHSMAGSIEVLTGLFSGQGISVADFLHFLVWATIGNSIGGVFFFGIIKYGHVIRSSTQVEEVSIEDDRSRTG